MSSSSNEKTFSIDAQVMVTIMKELGIEDFDEQVIKHLLEFNYKYSTMILEDAQRYSTFANKVCVDVDDVKLAIHFSQDKFLIKPPDREALIAASKEVNQKPLPPIKNTKGLYIPQDCALTSDSKLKTDLNLENDMHKAVHTTITTAAEILEVAKRRQNINNADLDIGDLTPYNVQGALENQSASEDCIEEMVYPEEFIQSLFYNNNSY